MIRPSFANEVPNNPEQPNRENCHYIHIEKNAPPTGQGKTAHWRPYIIKTNILTKLHEDWAIELGRDFIGTKLLTKFHEDGTRNVASKVSSNVNGQTDRRRTKTGHNSSPEQSAPFCSSLFSWLLALMMSDSL
ncbi:hypothetical protein DPMN_132035 [Dreissena polymorpha]|uniref:Uncharacterized protein n=1 Tax=Dreissena polymorpha TaxID=45954 RepID=A0A9D4JDD6_DREPO|nr:hypothetical protein DPMN_132035 [Dreissena polymorpha]